jgi:hypothetical protein
VQAAGLLAERARLIAVLRAEVAQAGPGTAAPMTWPPAAVGAPASAPTPAVPPAPRAPAPEWTRRKVQNLLLSLGVGLLAVAAVVFLVVSWKVLGIGGRAAVMTGCTLLAGGGAALADRRGLKSSAEAVSLLTVGLALLDAWGARSAGLGGLDDVDGLVYWAAALAVVAMLAAATAIVVPTRSLLVAAAVQGQLPVPLLAIHIGDSTDRPIVVLAGGLTIASGAAAGLAAGWWGGQRSRDARLVVAGGAGLAWLLASVIALVATYGEAGSLVPGIAVLLVLAVVAATVAILGHRPELEPPGLIAAAVLVVAASWAAPTVTMDAFSESGDRTWLAVVCSLIGLGLLVGAALIPRRYRPAPAIVAFGAAALPSLVAVVPALVVVLGQLGGAGHPWQAAAQDSARDLLATALGLDVSADLAWGLEVPAVLACLVLVLLAVAVLHGARRVLPGAVAVVAVAVLTLPVAAGWNLAAALGCELALAAVLLPTGSRLLGSARHLWGWWCFGTGAVLLGLAVAWSLAWQDGTLIALAIAVVVLVCAALLIGGNASLASVQLALGVAAAVLAVAEAAALDRAGGASWPAVWSLALGLAMVVAAAGAVVVSGQVRRGLVVVAAVSALGEAAALTVWGGGSVEGAGLAVAVTASALGAVAMWWDTLLGSVGRTSTHSAVMCQDVAVTAAVGGFLGVVLTVTDADRLWLALLATGVGAAIVSLRTGLHRVGWGAGVLLAASSWVRLWLADVDAPEPYTMPAGVALVALGMWRRRSDPTYSSWRAYGAGLGLMLVPSLLRALTDDGAVRPFVLGLVALVVVVSGVARRLKAPLVIGGLVLGIDGVVQLSPYLAAFYAAVPRWTWIAAAGLLLVTLGVTYESRTRDLRALRDQIARLG